MALVIRGTPDFRQGPLSPLFTVPMLSFLGVSRRKSPSIGEQWVVRYEGPASNNPEEMSPAEIGYSLVPLDFEAELEAFGPIYRLTVISPDYPGGGSVGIQQSNFQLAGNSLQFDMREHPKALGLGPAILKRIDNAIDGETAEIRAEALADVTTAGGNTLELYNLLRQRKGSGTFFKPQYVLRFDRLASTRASIDVGFSNVGKILTTAQMVAETGPPPGILSSIDDAATLTQPAAVSGYQWGWLKQTPTVQTVAGNKIQISGEYYLEFWSTWLYAPA
jgi:hypothetical protein